MTIDKPSAEGNGPRPTSNEHDPSIQPTVALAISTVLAALTGILTDWHTAATVFLTTVAMFTADRRAP